MDNPLDKKKPVRFRFSHRIINDKEGIKKYLPKNPWINHVSLKHNDTVCTFWDDYGPNIQDKIKESGMPVILAECYQTCGLKGNEKQLFQACYDKDNNYDKLTVENNFLSS